MSLVAAGYYAVAGGMYLACLGAYWQQSYWSGSSALLLFVTFSGLGFLSRSPAREP